jgi:hypothetical protein
MSRSYIPQYIPTMFCICLSPQCFIVSKSCQCEEIPQSAAPETHKGTSSVKDSRSFLSDAATLTNDCGDGEFVGFALGLPQLSGMCSLVPSCGTRAKK